MDTLHTTRIKLTLWYVFLSMFITILFSSVIYFAISSQFKRMEFIQKYIKENNVKINLPPDNFPLPRPENLDENSISNLRFNIQLTFISINVVVLFLSSLIGYFLAGRSLRPIKRMIDEQTRFIADASHELKTPITSLRSELEIAMIDEHMTVKDAKKLFQSFLEEVEDLQNLTDKLINLTALQKNRGQIKFEDISLLEILESAIKKVSSMAKRKQITIDLEVEDHMIRGEYQNLSELFVILLDNAIKYSPEKTQIGLLSSTIDNKLIVTVKDQGIGISDADSPHIFDRFYRVDKSRSGSEGFGLGLSIAKEIVKSHKGQLTVKSRLNKGSSFIVSLPLKG